MWEKSTAARHRLWNARVLVNLPEPCGYTPDTTSAPSALPSTPPAPLVLPTFLSHAPGTSPRYIPHTTLVQYSVPPSSPFPRSSREPLTLMDSPLVLALASARELLTSSIDCQAMSRTLRLVPLLPCCSVALKPPLRREARTGTYKPSLRGLWISGA